MGGAMAMELRDEFVLAGAAVRAAGETIEARGSAEEKEAARMPKGDARGRAAPIAGVVGEERDAPSG